MPARTRNLATAAKEYIWLWDHRHGASPEDIAAKAGVSPARVRLGLARAHACDNGEPYGDGASSGNSARSPRLIPMFPIVSFTPSSTCAHRRVLRTGSLFCCMVCHRSGIDGHPALKRDRRTDPSPEPKPAPPLAKKLKRETRKQIRARLFGTAPADGSRVV
jgi:hypothetical protein